MTKENESNIILNNQINPCGKKDYERAHKLFEEMLDSSQERQDYIPFMFRCPIQQVTLIR